MLLDAYEKVRSNKGSPGIDGVSFEDIEKAPGGVRRFLENIQNQLRQKTYQPKPVKRHYIPKPNGKLRPLGIPCIDDRVIQQAVLMIIEPIFEQDFQACSHGFRPGRSAKDALNIIQKEIRAGKQEINDADLSSYFDTIDHEQLISLVEKRIADRSILHLIRMRLKCPIIEEDKKTGQRKMTKPSQGTPQGGVISPLLANIYLNPFDKAFYEEEDSPSKKAKATLVRYADDFVVMVKKMTEGTVQWIEELIENKLKLTINKEKTKIVNLKEEKLNFLGYSFRYDKDLKGRPWKYLNTFPSAKAVDRFRENIREELAKMRNRPLKIVIDKINQKSRGWKGYFNMGYPRDAYRDINFYFQDAFKAFLKNRSQRKCKIRKSGESYYSALRRCGLQYL